MDIYEQEKMKLLDDYLERVKRQVSLIRYPSWTELQLLASKATKKKFKMMVDHLRHECSNCHHIYSEAATALDDWCSYHDGSHDPWKNYAKFKVLRQCKLSVHQLIRCHYPDLAGSCEEADKEISEYGGKCVIKYGKYKGLRVAELAPGHLLKLVMSRQTPTRLRAAVHDHLHAILVCL